MVALVASYSDGSMRVPGDPPLRLATLEEADAIEVLMKASIRHFFPAYYDAPQVEASLLYVGVPDRDLIDDGTYFVAEIDGELVACGGWSKRDKLYSGSDAAGDSRLLDPATEAAHVRAMFVRPDWGRRGLGRRIIEESEFAAKDGGFTTMSLMATLPGEPLYAACGFREIERTDVITPNGTPLPCVAMEKPIG
jgi:GNAT superfamily N-acetyltransferase